VSNIKEIEIVADVPWNWASDLPDSEAAVFAGLFFNPVIGVDLEQQDIGYVDNDWGGQTSMVRVQITGMEALAWPILDRLASALASVGTVSRARAVDPDDAKWRPLKCNVTVEETT
jgi:hypothetical protein